MASEESYNINDEHSEDDFDPEDSGPQGLRVRIAKNHNYGVSREQNHREGRRQTRGIRNINYSQSVRVQQTVGHENMPQRVAYGEVDDDQEDELDAQKEEDKEPQSVFSPNLDVILWKRFREDGTTEYLVKYKNRSYLHLQWLTESDLIDISKSAKNKLNRFNKTFDKKILEPNVDQETGEEKYFDPSYTEVDRILATTEIFPVVHQKKANEIRGKWSESIFLVCEKLLNFSRDNIHYGVFFSEPVNPERDNCPNYRKIIQNPIDLGTILNRILLDNYKVPLEFWKDLGLVWRNCRKFNQEHQSDIKLVGNTLRQASIYLYQQWHKLTTERYEVMVAEFKSQAHQINEVDGNVANTEKIENNVKQLGVQPQEQNKTTEIKESYQPVDQKLNPTNGIPQTEQKPAEEQPKPQEAENNLQQEADKKDSESKMQVQGQEKSDEPNNSEDNMRMEECLERVESEPNNSEDNLKMQESLERVESERSEKGEMVVELEPQPEEEYLKESCKNIFLQKRKAEPPMTEADLEKFNPGPLTYEWVLDEQETDQSAYQNYSYAILDQYDIKSLNLNIDVNKVYLVKWKNLSYTQATWQLDSSIASMNGQNKIAEFRAFNRALDKEARISMIHQNDRHKTLVDIEINPRKKARLGHTAIHEIRSKLYFMDVRSRKHQHIPQYTADSPPIYREYKMLRDYQLESLNWLINSWYHNRNVILADEMGLGKTIQSIAFLQHLWSIEACKGPFLVIAPLSTLEHWKRTVQEWTNLNCVLYYDHNGQAGRASIRYYEWSYTDISTKGSILQATELHKFHVLVTSFEVFLADFQNIMLKVPFQFVVVDEAHRLKNQNAKILQCLKQLPCKRVLLLTGTPIQNNTDELWSLLNYIEPDKFSRREEFRRQFGDLASSQQIQKLHSLLKPYMLRRMKEDVEQSIPPLQETIIDIEMTNLQKTIYRALYERNKGMLTKGFAGSAITTSLNNLQMQLRKCCNHPFLIKEIEAELMKECRTEEQRINKILDSSGKMTLVNKLLDKYRAQDKKVLIFSQFTYMLSLLQELLKFKGVKYEKIDGQIKAKQRQNSIDRYNNKEKKREVFLLSTKAGGIGINLTSANIVIIFDSDWNPQNDVQATARAHRIGQLAEVQVYRLVTAKTYESEMFERATRKLGLDQAIFIDGTFKTTKTDEGQEQRTGRHGKKEKIGRPDKGKLSKLSKNELETLLRRGMIGLYEENQKNEPGVVQTNDHADKFREVNVDDILEKNSRLAKYSVIKGSYTFAKSKFVSDQADNKLDLKDPNFWNIVLKNVESKSQKVLKKLEDLSKFKSLFSQQQIMLEVSSCVSSLIESKLSLSGYSADDEKNLNDVLTTISSSKVFNRPYRDMASTWLDDVNKPSRRFRKMTLQDFDISGKPNIGKTTRSKEEGYDMDQNKQKVFFDSDGESDQGNDLHVTKIKLDEQKKDELLRKLCYLCEKAKCTFFCKEYCKRAFHAECRARVEAGEVNIDGVEKFDALETNMLEERLRDSINVGYACPDCRDHNVLCFICKVKGKYYGAEYHKKKAGNGSSNNNGTSSGGNSVLRLIKKSAEENEDEVIIEEDPPETEKPQAVQAKRKNEVTKCSTANCAKFFHPKCIENFDGNSKFKYIDQKQLHFRCSLHYCFKCGESGDTMAIAQCIRCPRAFHLRCMDKDKITKVTKKLFICERHSKGKKKDVSKKPIKTQLLKKFAKHSKYESRGRMRQDRDASQESEIDEIEEGEIEPGIETGTKRTRSLYKKTETVKIPKLIPQQTRKVPYTYEELQIQPPGQFDFSKYPEDWCRYCGARFSSNFTQGPWGPKTLCTVHYINWKKKRSLILQPYMAEKPTTPINPHDDQELRYISSLKAKDPDVDIKGFVQNGGFEAYRKRMKKSFDSHMM